MAASVTIQQQCVLNSESANLTIVAFLTGPETLPYTLDFVIRRADTLEQVDSYAFVFYNTSSLYRYITLPNGSYNYYGNGNILMGTFSVNCIVLPPCDLNIVSATPTPDKNGTGSGAITINATSSYSLEYSKNQVTWQSSNVLTGYTAGTYTVYVRDSNSCHAEKTNVTIINTPCDISIASTVKTDETGENANNGSVTIVGSTSSGPIQYNLNGGAYQSSGSFTGLAPGIHTVYLLDAVGCTTFVNITIAEFIPEVVPPDEIPCFDPIMVFSETLPYRFVTRHCNDDDDLDKLYAENEHCGVYAPCYFQPLNCNDVFTMQFYYMDAEYNTVPVLVFKNFTTQLPLYTLEFTSLGSGYYKIEKNVSEMSVLCGKRVYLEVQSYHTVAEENLFTHAVSEPLKISNNHNCNILLEYWNDSNFDEILYENTGYINHLRLEAIFDLEETPQEDEVYVKSNGERVSIFSSLHEVWNLEVGHAPTYLHKKIALALSHQHIRINGKEYVKEEPYDYERIEKFALRKGVGKLTAKAYQSKNLIK